MVKIRLAQYGAKNRRTYRIVVIEERERRNGQPVETLGFYNPLVNPPQVKIDTERIAYWKSQGAIIMPSVAKLLEKLA